MDKQQPQKLPQNPKASPPAKENVAGSPGKNAAPGQKRRQPARKATPQPPKVPSFLEHFFAGPNNPGKFDTLFSASQGTRLSFLTTKTNSFFGLQQIYLIFEKISTACSSYGTELLRPSLIWLIPFSWAPPLTQQVTLSPLVSGTKQ